MKLVETVRGTVRFCNGRHIIISRGARLYPTELPAQNPKAMPAPPLGLVNQMLTWLRLSRRLTRREINHVRQLPAGEVLALGCGGVFLHTNEAGWRHMARLVGRRPLALAVTPEGSSYYGEYRDNAERSPIAVWGSEDSGKTWRAVWTFSDVRHVHGVFHDPHENTLWVTTGDRDEESGLWRTRDRFGTLELVNGGSQQFRVVQPLFTPDAVLFGSDAPDEVNWLQRMDRHSGLVTRTQQVGGAVFYGTQSGPWVFFSTVVEPSRINTTREAEVWASRDDGRTWTKVLSFKKDWWPSRLFQYGQVLFPAGPGCPGRLWLTPLATRGDQVSLCYELPS